MSGSLAQSYFIFDANNYKVCRKIYFSVQEEEEEPEDKDDIGALLGDNANDAASEDSAPSSSSIVGQTIESRASQRKNGGKQGRNHS